MEKKKHFLSHLLSSNSNNISHGNTSQNSRGHPSGAKSRSRSVKRNLSNVSACSSRAVADVTPVRTHSSSSSTSHPLQPSNKHPRRLQLSELSSDSIERNFEDLLDDMNVTEESKIPLRTKSVAEKACMLEMQLAVGSREMPADFVNFLRDPSLKTERQLDVLASLSVSLKSNPVSWVRQFDSPALGGLRLILEHLEGSVIGNNTSKRAVSADSRISLACIRCLRGFGNSGYGLRKLVEHDSAATTLARCLLCASPDLMQVAVEVLMALAITGKSGHHRVLEGLTSAAEVQRFDRFQPLVQGLMNQANPVLQQVCLQLINVIVSPPFASGEELDLDFRLHLRLEFYGLGLRPLLQAMCNIRDPTLAQHASIFEHQAERDQEQFFDRFDSLRLELDDLHECFRLLSRSICDSDAERYVLSILQHLLIIGEDPVYRINTLRVVEECVSQLVMQRTNSDPDPRCSGLKLQLSTLLSKMAELPEEAQPRRTSDLQVRLDRALQEKQEAEAALESLRGRLTSLEAESESQRANTREGLQRTVEASLRVGPGIVSPLPPPSTGGSVTIPPPPPPPPPSSKGLPSTPNLMLPPPPPPAPGVGSAGKRGHEPAANQKLPFGMKPKKQYKLDVTMKKANWKAINPSKLDKSSVWVGFNEDRLMNDELLEEIQSQFCTKQTAGSRSQTGSVNSGRSGGGGIGRNGSQLNPSIGNNGISSVAGQEAGTLSRKPRQMRLLDSRAACNLGLVLGCIKTPIEELVMRIEDMDDVTLSPALIEQMVKFLPDMSKLGKFAALKPDFNDLARPEQLCCLLASVKHLSARLNSLIFRERFPEILGEVKPDIVAANEALREIQTSRKLARLLELVLLVGNLLNTGSRNGQAVGFELGFLVKLSGTKDRSNSRSLVHFLAEYVERMYPELLDCLEEINYLDRARQVSEESVQESVEKVLQMTRRLDQDLATAKRSQDDHFIRRVSELAGGARAQADVVAKMAAKMQESFCQVAKYLAFDPKTYPMESLFSDLATFKDQFKAAKQENTTRRVTEERVLRAQEDRQRRQRENEARRLANSRQTNEESEGVMDALLGALKKGAPFSPDRGAARGRPLGSAARLTGSERQRQLSKSRSRGLGLTTKDTIVRQLQFEETANTASHQRIIPTGNKSEAELILERLKQL